MFHVLSTMESSWLPADSIQLMNMLVFIYFIGIRSPYQAAAFPASESNSITASIIVVIIHTPGEWEVKT